MQKSVNSPNVDLENNMMRNLSVPFLAPLRRRMAAVIAIAGCVVLMHVDANAAQPAASAALRLAQHSRDSRQSVSVAALAGGVIPYATPEAATVAPSTSPTTVVCGYVNHHTTPAVPMTKSVVYA